MMRVKVEAFTIMEMAIGMLLAAIVIAITYTSYGIVSKAYLTYNKRQADVSELSVIESPLQREFHDSRFVRFKDNGLTFEYPDRSVSYAFLDSMIVRTAGSTDTIRLKAIDLNSSFESNSRADSLIDDLSFSVLLHQRVFLYHYHKHYSSSELIEATSHAIN